MSKKKKKRDKFPHVVPVDYLMSVADQLHKTNPAKAIIYNTIMAVWKEGYNKGYFRRLNESKRFKEKEIARIDKDFKLFCDKLDDEIHEKSNKPKN